MAAVGGHDRCLERGSEIDGPVVAVLASGLNDVPDANVPRVRCQDVGAVARTSHPRLKHGFCIDLASGDILRDEYPIVPCVAHALGRVRAVTTRVAEQVVVRHVARMPLGGGDDTSLHHQVREARAISDLVHQLEHLLCWGPHTFGLSDGGGGGIAGEDEQEKEWRPDVEGSHFESGFRGRE